MVRRMSAAIACTGALVVALLAPAPGALADSTPRIDLRVLVVDDGGPSVAAVAAELASEGTPYTTVNLTDSNHPQIDAAFLSGTSGGRPEAKYQAVVLPNDDPFPAGDPQMQALATYEQTYGIRQVDAYTYARPAVGLAAAATDGYSGSLDGTTAQVTSAGTAGPFGYLKGSVPFEDNSPTVSESYGYLAAPLSPQAAGATFTPLVDEAIPGSTQRGSLVGEYDHDGRSELVVTFAYNQYQQQFRLLARGMVEWLTQGVHLGADRDYFAVHFDDMFMSDDRWNTQLKCTPGDVDCPVGTGPGTDPIRMTAADAQYAEQWSKAHGLTFDFVFNGGGSDDYTSDNGSDPLATELTGHQGDFRWIDHTYDHAFLGCVQDTTVVPWKCQTDSSGATQWVSQSDITQEITKNEAWAASHGLSIDDSELVTGEHSGLAILPQQPQDNPNLAPALTGTGIAALASDASRESAQRQVGSALTVPRHPVNVYYNAGHVGEEVDEYNWIYTSKSQGGSGLCDNSTTTTCLSAPLDTQTGYTSYIVPLESRIALGHVLGNDPFPHYMHQSNLAEDRIAYPLLEKILGDYANLFASDTPIVNLRMADIATELQRRAQWNAALNAGQVTAYRIGDTVTIQAPNGVDATATMPAGTTQQQLLGTSAFGSAYAGRVSGWTSPGLLQSAVTLNLPATTTAAALHPATAAAVQRPAARLPLPAGVRHPVPAGPGAARR